MNLSLEDFSLLGKSLFLCSLAFVFLFARALWELSFSKLPPGPWGLPIIGASFRLGKDPHLDFTKMAKKYGDVFSLMLGNRLVVVLNGVDVIQETIIKLSTAFAGRPKLHTFQLANPQGNSLVLSDYSHQWRISRKMSVSSIQNFARNTHALEEKLLLESQRLVKNVKQQTGEPADVLMTLKCATANVILNALFGVERSYDDEDLRRIFKLNKSYGEALHGSGYVDFLPLLKYLPSKSLSNLVLTVTTISDVITQMYKKNKESYNDGRVRNIADTFASVVKEETESLPDGGDASRLAAPVLSDEQIVSALADLFGGAFDTSSSTLYWSLAYLIKYPDIQHQLHDELDRVIGRARLPTLQDIPSLPLLQATVYEILRVTSYAPLAIPRSTTTETKIRGFIIPKDTMVFVNLWSVHRDPETWKDPEVFDPMRFLDSQGQVIDPKSLGGFMPFSVGRRQCPGEALALRVIPVFLAVLLHSFRFTQDGLPAKYRGINIKGQFGLGLAAEKFFMKIEERS